MSSILYAIIMCGSRGYTNYRHQADVYAWVNILLNRGYKRENIITISYDDVAAETKEIYHTCDGPNMYLEGAVNYSSIQASKDQFIKSINGINNKKANVLIVYINHGAYNFLSTPNGFDRPIYIDDFTEAINNLANRVRKVLCIVEACFSGSFARQTKYARNVIIMTAASAREPSYAYSWCPRLKVYTSNEFTYHVLNYLDDKRNDKKYLKDMYDTVKHQTNMSTVVCTSNIYRVLLKDFFGTIGKHSDHILGDVSISTVRRIKNTLRPQAPLQKVWREVLHYLIKEVANSSITNWTLSDQRRALYTRQLTALPENKQQCYKMVSNTAIQFFMTKYLDEDNIEFVHDFGLLCISFNTNDIIKAIEGHAERKANKQRLRRISYRAQVY